MNKRKFYYALFFLSLFILTVYSQKGGGESGYRYIDLTYEMSRGKLNIDDVHDNTQDKAFYNGHYYIATAPGLSLFNLPPFLIFKITY